MGGFAAVGAGGNILWSAAIDDQTGQFFTMFDRRISDTGSKAKRSFADMGIGGRMSAAAMGMVAGATAKITGELIRMGLQAVAQFKAFVAGSVQLAARADTLAVSLNVVGRNVGYTQEELSKLEESVKKNGITTNASRQILLKMAQAHLDLTKATELTRMAQDAAVIANINSSEAAERMIHGITTLSPLILRHMGIIVDLEQEYKKATGGIKGATEALTYAQKVDIAMNAVLGQSTTIAGTYEAAMGTAGKQAASMARHQEELQLAIGRTMQPAYRQWIQFITENLKEAKEWFDKNEGSVRQLTIVLSTLSSVGVGAMDLILASVKTLIGGVAEAAEWLAVLASRFSVIQDMSKKEAETGMAGVGETFGRIIAMAISGWAVIFTYIHEVLKGIKDTFTLFGEATTTFSQALMKNPLQSWEQMSKTMQPIYEKADGIATRLDHINEIAQGVAGDVLVEWSEKLGLIERQTEKIGDEMDTGARAKAIAAETEGIIEEIGELNAKIGEEAMEAAKQMEREAIDAAIELARRQEDIARDHAKRIADIKKSYAKKYADAVKDQAKKEREAEEDMAEERMELEQDKADEIVSINEEYTQRLEDIQRSFAESSDEAARNNDAVEMARIIRSTNNQLEEAKIARDRNKGEAQQSYEKDFAELQKHQSKKRAEIIRDRDERMEELREELAEELAEAEASHQEELEELERSLAREKEDKERHRQWDEEDRMEKHASELKSLAEHMAQLQYIDESGLQSILAAHGQYIADDIALWEQYYSARAGIEQAAEQAVGQTTYNSPWGTSPEEHVDPSTGTYSAEWGMARGGIGLVTHPTRVMVGEEPEVVAAIPLSSVVTHRYAFDMNSDVRFSGVSANTEQKLEPVMIDTLRKLAERVYADVRGRR